MSATSPPSLRAFDEPKMEAIVELMYLAATADGEFSDEERTHFLKSVESLTDRQIATDGVDRVVARLEADLASRGREGVLALAKERLETSALRKVAYSLAVAVVASDGIIRTSERELLLEMADALDLDRDEAADLVAQLAPS
ncbi:MAG TPA: tellurite resistance TerB family protein [Candidatus Nanopelagicales bacterium]|nr:tellurite resistance TerB family protein [Candidatus Nanopelagicales bacterium]